MKRTVLMATAASALILASGTMQSAQAQRAGARVSSGQHWGGQHWGGQHHHYRGGWGGGWGWGAGALIGSVAALATAPLWGGGYYADPYAGYGYGGYGAYGGYPYGYGYAEPVYYEEPYVTYAPRPVVYTTRVVRPRVARVRYAEPRRVVHRGAYRPQAQRIVVRDGARRAGRVMVR